jgi:hypothetical protein
MARGGPCQRRGDRRAGEDHPFGGIARNGELLMAPLREHFEEALLNIYRGKVELMLSELPEDDAGILGAAALAESPS